MSDEYNCVANGKLKLKNNAGIKKIKKKKSRKTDDKYLQFNGEKEPQLEFGKNQYHRNNDTTNQNNNSNNRLEMEQRSLTKAEIAFKKQQEKMRNKRILEKASTTHKQRVESFNEHLDTLTEHFDIPKVSWTK